MRSLRLWDHDLHPRTLEGKAASAQNARKLGLRSAEWKALTFALRIQNQELKKLI
ncbi:MAG: hypothetical protein KA155_07070 [Alphaproteobacteria bacterium]|nr:hypothetical protein [Alphaproteobacteria bacterium]